MRYSVKYWHLNKENKREIDSIILAYLLRHLTLESNIAIRSMNINQYDTSGFLIPDMPSSMASGQRYSKNDYMRPEVDVHQILRML